MTNTFYRPGAYCDDFILHNHVLSRPTSSKVLFCKPSTGSFNIFLFRLCLMCLSIQAKAKSENIFVASLKYSFYNDKNMN